MKVDDTRLSRMLWRAHDGGKTQRSVAEQIGMTPAGLSLRVRRMREQGMELPEFLAGTNGFRDSLSREAFARIVRVAIDLGGSSGDVSRYLGISTTAVLDRISRLKMDGIDVPTFDRKKQADKRAEIFSTHFERARRRPRKKRLDTKAVRG